MVKNPHKYLAKVALREIKHNWAQFLSMIAIGAIAVTLFVGLLANADSIESRVDSAYQMGNMADIWLTLDETDEKAETHIKSFLDSNDEIDTRFEFPCKLVNTSSVCAVSKTMPKISKPYSIDMVNEHNSDDHFFLVDYSFYQAEPNKWDPMAGDDKLSREVIIDLNSIPGMSVSSFTQFDDLLEVNPGKTSFISSGELVLEFQQTGLMHYPENVMKASYSAGVFLVDDASFRSAFVGKINEIYTERSAKLIMELLHESKFKFGDGTIEKAANPDEVFCKPNQYLIDVKKHSKISSIKAELKDFFQARGNLYSITDRNTMPFVITLANDVKQARNFTFVFPFVFFIVGVLIILTTISRMIVDERGEIGTLKALGLTKLELYRHYIFLALAVVSIGIIIGEIVGPILIPFVLGQKYSILYLLPARKFVFPWLTGIITATVYLGVTALVTFLIARKEIKLVPAESMRPAAPTVKTSMFAKSKRKEHALGLSFKMAVRNIFSDITKSIMVIVGVMGCTALITCGFGINDSLDYGLDNDFSMMGNMDAQLNLSVSKDIEYANALLSPHKDKILSYEPFIRVDCDFHKHDGDGREATAYFSMFEQTHYLEDPHIEKSHIPTSIVSLKDANKCAISEKTSNETGAKVGDYIDFRYMGVDYSIQIERTYKAFLFNGVFVDYRNPLFSTLGYTDIYLDCTPSFEEISKKPSGVIGDEGKELSNIEVFLKNIKDSDSNISSYTLRYELLERTDNILGGVRIMTNTIIIFAILLALVVLYNLALLNFQERVRDIATLKVLGFSSFEIAFSLMFETLTLTLVGVLFGLLLGYPFTLIVMKLNIVELVYYLYHIDFISYILAFALTFVVSFLINGIMSAGSRRVKMVESLKSIE